MKKIFPLLAGAALLAMVGTSGCAQKGATSGEAYKRVPAKEHADHYPQGHDGSKSCYYDEKGDVYFCAY
ncbi:MAG: hypothetical protein KQH63_11185 [Desulfobulbaceae bacterium]|nr:hypothetical protein [Desulfobulbaceae bacterium]